MMRKINFFIHNRSDWPNFTWDSESLMLLLGSVRNAQGKLIGKMDSIGFDLRNQANLETITLDIIKSSEIEGEILDPKQVRSSIARKLGLEVAGLVESARHVDGIVEMMLDATQNALQPLTKERLFDWHAALFPTGRSGMYKIIVADWRDDSTGPMQVVSGGLGKQRVHFQAPDAKVIEKEMMQFLDWLNTDYKIDLVIKAAIAHLWFVTIHPFEDGNGRITRAISDMLLARADGIPQRFYSMSAQIRNERKEYYKILEKTQRGSLDLTNWIQWFLNCLMNAIHSSELTLESVLFKHRFWNKNANKSLNKRQVKLLDKLLEDFKGNLTATKWAKIAKCSHDTALRDIQDLIKKGILIKTNAGGRSTNYVLMEVEK